MNGVLSPAMQDSSRRVLERCEQNPPSGPAIMDVLFRAHLRVSFTKAEFGKTLMPYDAIIVKTSWDDSWANPTKLEAEWAKETALGKTTDDALREVLRLLLDHNQEVVWYATQYLLPRKR